ncbi:MAG: peroxidase family protein, partial [Xanthobacteraceae bacterium]
MSRQNDGFEFKLSWYQRLLSAIFRVVNIFVSWDRLGKLIGAVNIATLRDRLRRDNLHHAGYGVQAATPWVAGNERWRSADGSYNSLDHPRMGMAGSRFARNVPLSEAIPDSGAALLDPSPRVISRELMARETFKPATTLNLLAAAWIQFETHDWFSHGQPIKNDPDPHKIPLPPGDDWPDAIGGCMHIRRSRRDPTPREPWLGGTPTFVNDNSHWWDAAQLYSSDRKRQERIRSGADGTIRLGADGMLPDDETHPGIDFTGFNDNWWIGLSLLHNLFAREHNAICAALKREYPAWDDEELFQRARLINAALIAKIHTVEWTPGILGHPALDFGMHANWS